MLICKSVFPNFSVFFINVSKCSGLVKETTNFYKTNELEQPLGVTTSQGWIIISRRNQLQLSVFVTVAQGHNCHQTDDLVYLGLSCCERDIVAT